MGRLDGKVAVITGGSSGMALAGAKLFVDEGAHVVIAGRRQEALDQAVKLIGRNSGVPRQYEMQASSAPRRRPRQRSDHRPVE